MLCLGDNTQAWRPGAPRLLALSVSLCMTLQSVDFQPEATSGVSNPSLTSTSCVTLRKCRSTSLIYTSSSIKWNHGYVLCVPL